MRSLIEPNHICTKDEIRNWMMKNLNLRLEIQTHNGIKNLVATFTPFPIKYYNYVKRYYRYNKNKRRTRRNIDTNTTVWIQIQRGLTYKSLPSNVDSGIVRPWLSDGFQKEQFSNGNNYRDLLSSYRSFGRYIVISKNRYKLLHKFTYHLSPTDVRKGYKVLLQNIEKDKDDNCIYYGYRNHSTNSRPYIDLKKYPIYIAVYCGGTLVNTCPNTDTIRYNTHI